VDDHYQVYVNRVIRMTLPESYRSQIPFIQESAKFQPTVSGTRVAMPFPGYTVVTPTGPEDELNTAFYEQLKQYQQQIVETLGESLFVPVPPDSFHLTLADLIWSDAFNYAVKDPEFEPRLHDCIRQTFSEVQSDTYFPDGLRWQVLGLTVMPRAIAICLAPKDESFYLPIVNVRRAIYQNSDLIALGIEQQYHFTAHVTLGYFGSVSDYLEAVDKADPAGPEQLSQMLSNLNQIWLDGTTHEFGIQRAELRKFDDMTRFYRKPDWPVLQF